MARANVSGKTKKPTENKITKEEAVVFDKDGNKAGSIFVSTSRLVEKKKKK